MAAAQSAASEVRSHTGHADAARRLADKGRARLRALVGLGMRQTGFGVETAAHLYQALVRPILLYGAEVVGYSHSAGEALERVDRQQGEGDPACLNAE